MLAGQRKVPKRIKNSEYGDWPIFATTLGFTLGEEVDQDFLNVGLPPGWVARRATTFPDQDVELIDSFGVVRAEFIWRSREITFLPRYKILPREYYKLQEGKFESSRYLYYVIVDSKKDVFLAVTDAVQDLPKSFVISSSQEMRMFNDHSVDTSLIKLAAEDWLRERFPDFQNPLLYWQEED